MQAISTSFNKLQMNQCTDRCIVTLQHSYFTPDEIRCFQRCTRNMPKFQPYANRIRSDSEEVSSQSPNL